MFVIFIFFDPTTPQHQPPHLTPPHESRAPAAFSGSGTPSRASSPSSAWAPPESVRASFRSSARVLPELSELGKRPGRASRDSSPSSVRGLSRPGRPQLPGFPGLASGPAELPELARHARRRGRPISPSSLAHLDPGCFRARRGGGLSATRPPPPSSSPLPFAFPPSPLLLSCLPSLRPYAWSLARCDSGWGRVGVSGFICCVG